MQHLGPLLGVSVGWLYLFVTHIRRLITLVIGSWVVISGVRSKVTKVITRIRGRITMLITTHEPPSSCNHL